MTGKDLKNSILQLAIQGKLVPQNPNEEPASELLARIRQEKERLVKEKKLKKKDLETTPITDEEKPFAIPESWEWCRLGEICKFLSRGKSPKYSDTPNQYPVFAQKCNLKDGGISLEQARFLDPKTIDKWQEELKLKTDDILVNSTGTGTVCRTRLFHEKYLKEYPFTLPDSHVSVIRTFEDIDSAFYFFIFNSKHIQDYWEDHLAGSTNQKELYIGTLHNTIIPLPPLAEQQRIVAKIEELMPLVEEYDKNEQKLAALNKALPERLRQSVLQQAIMGRLVPQDDNDEPASELLARIRQEKERLVKEKKLKKKDLETTPIEDYEKPFEIPESWEWCRLGDVMNIVMGQSPESDVINYQSGIEFHQGKIAFTDYLIANSGIYTTKPTKIAESDSLLICVRAPIGNVNYTDRRICIGRGLCSIRPLYNAEIKYWFYSMECLKPILEKKGTGSTFKAISLDVLKMQSIPLPPLAEQQRIVAKIEELFSVIDNLKTC